LHYVCYLIEANLEYYKCQLNAGNLPGDAILTKIFLVMMAAGRHMEKGSENPSAMGFSP
jgi:hypothetical protein